MKNHLTNRSMEFIRNAAFLGTETICFPCSIHFAQLEWLKADRWIITRYGYYMHKTHVWFMFNRRQFDTVLFVSRTRQNRLTFMPCDTCRRARGHDWAFGLKKLYIFHLCSKCDLVIFLSWTETFMVIFSFIYCTFFSCLHITLSTLRTLKYRGR